MITPVLGRIQNVNHKAEMQSPRVLVAGGSGFIGGHLAATLIERGVEVVALDNDLFARARIAEAMQPSSLFMRIQVDARSEHDIIEAMQPYRVRAVVNCVGPARPSYYRRFPTTTAESLLRSTTALLRCARKWDALFVHASSSEVYGDVGSRPISENQIGFVDTLSDRAAYAEAKRACETLAWQYEREFHLTVRILRLFNIYGPGFGSDDDRVIPRILRSLRDGTPIPIHGTGKQVRSFCHVSDAVAAFVKAIDLSCTEPKCINIGNPEPITITNLAITMARAAGLNPLLESLPPIEDEIHFRCPDITLARTCLGWQPQIPLAVGIPALVRDFL